MIPERKIPWRRYAREPRLRRGYFKLGGRRRPSGGGDIEAERWRPKEPALKSCRKWLPGRQNIWCKDLQVESRSQRWKGHRLPCGWQGNTGRKWARGAGLGWWAEFRVAGFWTAEAEAVWSFHSPGSQATQNGREQQGWLFGLGWEGEAGGSFYEASAASSIRSMQQEAVAASCHTLHQPNGWDAIISE